MKASKVLRGLILTLGASALVLGVSVASAATGPASSRVGLQRTGPGTFSIDVDGADVRTVVRAVSEFSGRNIIVANQVRGNVSISLQNVGWEDALRTMLRSAGLDYVDEGGILRVDDGMKLRTEEAERAAAIAKAHELQPLDTRVVALNYANAQELTTPLAAALTKRGSVLVERRTNSLIISDLPQNLDRVEKMARDLDSQIPQIEITAKLVDVDAEALQDLGIRWNVGGGDPDLSEDLDLPADVNQPLNPGNDGDQVMSGGVDEPSARRSFRLSYALLKDWGSIEAQLQMLAQDRKANIISNPRITTVDNREAKILVGQKIPLIIQDVSGNPVSQLQTVGIQLKVTPHLTLDKKVIMDLHPEVSDLSTGSTVQGGVIINTSEADTRVMVDDGQTAVIGGLIRSNENVIRRGVPLFKDLPLIGFLFSSSSTVRQNRELIIFVTPRIVQSNPGE